MYNSYEKGMVVMATIALFSGQGSQYEKMGLDLVQQDAALEEIFEVASEVLGFDLYAVIADSDAHHLCPAGNHGNFSDLPGGSQEAWFHL